MNKNRNIPVLKLSTDAKILYDRLNKESDMACVVIGASFLGEVLSLLLKNKLIKSSKTVNKILEPDTGFLGSYIRRTEMAYCLGLIDNKIFTDLKKIAEIRNEFAHSYIFLSFESDKIKKLCNGLKSYMDAYPDILKSKDGKQLNTFLEMPTKKIFNETVTVISQRLMIKNIHFELDKC